MAIHAQGLEHHHTFLYKASVAVGGLKVKDAELEVGLNDMQPRLSAIERELSLIKQGLPAAAPGGPPEARVLDLEGKVAELRDRILQEEAETKKTVEEIRNKVLTVVRVLLRPGCSGPPCGHQDQGYGRRGRNHPSGRFEEL